MKQYTIRVYGIVTHNNCVLLSDECVGETYFTKFPGGGHEWGEGISETLNREFREELNAEIAECKQFYIADFFVTSKFDPNKQVISIYYLTKLKHPEKIPASNESFDFDHHLKKAESVRWVPIEQLTPETVTFPIDQKALTLFLETGSN